MGGWTQPLVFLSGVIMGTGSTITIKLIYGLEAIGLSGELQRFEKPLFTTWVMFLAMMLALPAHYYVRWRKRSARAQRKVGLRLNGGTDEEPISSDELDVPWRTLFLLAIPACFDLLGTALSGIGLLFTTVSVYQLVRCTVIIVTALLKATVLKHRLSGFMWFGIAINTLAMVLVSLTSFLPGAAAGGEAGENRDPRVGIFFIILSCLVQGSQYVFEERVMTVDNAPPLIVVGMEGLWGAILMPLIVFPWAYILPGSDQGGCVENFWDAWVMLLNSRAIQIVLLVFTITVFLYNIFCIYVTFLLSSIWHAILENFRPVSVWGTDLILYYLITDGVFGEEWNKYSWIQFIGMVLLFVGTAVYNGSLEIPGFEYEGLVEEDLDGEVGGHHQPSIRVSELSMASPNITRSPIISRSLAMDRRGGGVTAEFAPILNLGGAHGGNGRNEDDEESMYGSTSDTFQSTFTQQKKNTRR